MTYQSSSPWIVTPSPRPDARLRLFCFPFAGGSASFYHDWQQRVPEHVEVSAIELPGRGIRFGEPLRYHMSTITDPLVEALKPLCDKPFIIFGHSLGSLIGFETARRLQHAGYKAQAFIASGRRACVPREGEPLHTLEDQALVERLSQYNGTPDEILHDPDMRALFLPIIRADLQVNETYEQSVSSQIHCPVFAFAGNCDKEAPPQLVDRWSSMTVAEFSMTPLDGGHFFLKEDQNTFMTLLNRHIDTISNKIN